jgi:hypothetical protein
MRRISLTVVMLGMGAALIAGAGVSIVPNALMDLDRLVGTHASVAAAALGVGMCAAAVNPAAHLSWVRIGILYSALVVLYQAVIYLALGVPPAPAPLAFSLACGVLLVLLYPHRRDLLPKTPKQAQPSPVFPGKTETA